jgi:peptidoglycan/LPS O-acetylase OafA/YrhL
VKPTVLVPHAKYRPDVDGLRAFAVLAVIGFHAFPNLLRAGFIGVDVFFVLSGFLISSIILEQLDAGRFSFASFYARRVKRILPALTLVLVASLGYGWFVLLPDEFETLGKHVFSGTVFLSNFVLWSESGYFDGAAETKPLLHLWSLAIEEQFYLLWPLVLAIAWRRRWNILLVTCGIALLSFLLGLGAAAWDNVAGFYSPLTRFWELMVGAVLAHRSMHGRAGVIPHANLRSITGFSLLLAGLAIIDPNAPFPGWPALLPTLGTFLIVSAGPHAWLNRTLLASRPAVWIGLISYPLYLWHWPLLVWPKITLGELTSPLERMLLVLASVGLAWLTYRLVEVPIRRGTNRAAVRLLVWPFGLAGLAALAVALGLIGSRHDSAALSRILAARLDWSFPGHAFSRVPNVDLRYFVAESAPARTVFIGDSNMEHVCAAHRPSAARAPGAGQLRGNDRQPAGMRRAQGNHGKAWCLRAQHGRTRSPGACQRGRCRRIHRELAFL